jgi:hypothetical protein
MTWLLMTNNNYYSIDTWCYCSTIHSSSSNQKLMCTFLNNFFEPNMLEMRYSSSYRASKGMCYCFARLYYKRDFETDCKQLILSKGPNTFEHWLDKLFISRTKFSFFFSPKKLKKLGFTTISSIPISNRRIGA